MTDQTDPIMEAKRILMVELVACSCEDEDDEAGTDVRVFDADKYAYRFEGPWAIVFPMDTGMLAESAAWPAARVKEVSVRTVGD